MYCSEKLPGTLAMINSIQECSNKAEWDSFVSRSPHYNLFCTTQFLDAYAKDYDLVVVKNNKSILL